MQRRGPEKRFALRRGQIRKDIRKNAHRVSGVSDALAVTAVRLETGLEVIGQSLHGERGFFRIVEILCGKQESSAEDGRPVVRLPLPASLQIFVCGFQNELAVLRLHPRDFLRGEEVAAADEQEVQNPSERKRVEVGITLLDIVFQPVPIGLSHPEPAVERHAVNGVIVHEFPDLRVPREEPGLRDALQPQPAELIRREIRGRQAPGVHILQNMRGVLSAPGIASGGIVAEKICRLNKLIRCIRDGAQFAEGADAVGIDLQVAHLQRLEADGALQLESPHVGIDSEQEFFSGAQTGSQESQQQKCCGSVNGMFHGQFLLWVDVAGNNLAWIPEIVKKSFFPRPSFSAYCGESSCFRLKFRRRRLL